MGQRWNNEDREENIKNSKSLGWKLILKKQQGHWIWLEQKECGGHKSVGGSESGDGGDHFISSLIGHGKGFSSDWEAIGGF